MSYGDNFAQQPRLGLNRTGSATVKRGESLCICERVPIELGKIFLSPAPCPFGGLHRETKLSSDLPLLEVSRLLARFRHQHLFGISLAGAKRMRVKS